MTQPLASTVFFEGEFRPYHEAKISVLTHGFNYGTGCFEGIRGYWNAEAQEVFLLQPIAHFERIRQSAKVLQAKVPYSPEELLAIARELIRRNGFKEDVYVRPLVYLADELIGVRLHGLRAELTMFAVPMAAPLESKGITVGTSSWRRMDDTSAPARAKLTGAYINSALAKSEAYQNGHDDAILLNQDGSVSEGSGMNIFAVRRNKLVTPSVDQNILEGITRALVMQIAREELGLEVEERPLDRTELFVSDEAFMCGTGVQIQPVLAVDRRPVGEGEIGPVTRRIMEIYAQAVRGRYPRLADWVAPVYQQPSLA